MLTTINLQMIVAMINLSHIVEGWGKSLGLFEVTEENKQLSLERLNICATSGKDGGHCEKASKSTVLTLLRGEAHDLDAIFCDGCGCPVNESSLVIDKKCPLGKW